MRERLRQVARRRGAQAAAGTIAVCAVLAGVGAASAAEDHSVLGTDALVFEPADITVQTGDTVTWEFTGAQTSHNAEDDPENASTGDDAQRWASFNTAGPSYSDFNEPGSFTFNNPGTYYYVCIVHLGNDMRGVVRVEGDPVEPTPTASPTATATATVSPTATPSATPTATPTPDDHTFTPEPTGAVAAADAVPPAVGSLKAKWKRGKKLAKVRLELSETSTVTVRIKRKAKVVRTARLQVRAGEQLLKVRTRKLRPARYTVEVVARDVKGNESALARTSFRVKRKR